MSVTVFTFYKFVEIADREVLRSQWQAECDARALRGTILIATEGVNATLSGQREALDGFMDHLRQDARFADVDAKVSTAAAHPFGRMKVKLKREIVTLGQPEANPAQRVGTYVPPTEWNRIIQDPEVVLIDARNDYEVSIGTFLGAVNPQTQSFRQLPDYVHTHLNPAEHRKVAMFCTGGIRCEKATAYLLNQGFEEVYHLQGGILKYLEEVPAEQSLWQGECFVFDERVAVRHGLAPGSYDMCRACGHPVSAGDRAEPTYQPGISCPHCYDTLTPEKRDRQLMRQRQYEQQHGCDL